MRYFTALLLASTVAVSAGQSSAADMKNQMSTPHFHPSGKAASVELGHTVFNDHCALCHGLFGKGDGPRSAFFQNGVQFIPDLTVAGYTEGRDEQLLQHIREGLRRLPRPAYVMPQFKYILSEEEIQSSLLYVKKLRK
jgi:mono/diheme cytochrome c family protein